MTVVRFLRCAIRRHRAVRPDGEGYCRCRGRYTFVPINDNHGESNV